VALGVAAILLTAPAVASADGLPAFTIGPVKVKHGYSLTVFGSSCGTKYAGGLVLFTKAGSGWTEIHTYGGGKRASCHLASNLSSGSLKFSIGNEVSVNITFSKHGSKRRVPLAAGCTGQQPIQQAGIAKGTFNIKISKSLFGSVSLHRVKAMAQSSPTSTCKPTRAYKKTYFLNVSTVMGTSNLALIASLPPRGPALVSIFQSDTTSAGFSSHSLTITGGSSLFSAMSDLSSAKVNGSGKLHGHLKFTATPSCKGNSRTGTISGSLTANFDLIGNQTIKPGTPPPYADLYRNATGQPCH
jgi:hypothetical protein